MNLSRRDLIKGAAGLAGLAAGARVGGPLGLARAAGETSHLVFVYFPGGLNQALAGLAQPLINRFGITSSNIEVIGNGVSTDKATFGTLPKIARDHWFCAGALHGHGFHTFEKNPLAGGEFQMTRKGTTSYLTRMAAAMGGTSAFKAVHLGDAFTYRVHAATAGVSMQRITDLGSAIKALGAGEPEPGAPDRAIAAESLELGRSLSKAQLADSPRGLVSLGEAYDSSVDALRKPVGAKVAFSAISDAYGLAGSASVGSFRSQMAAAEVMIHSAGTNVVSVFSNGSHAWDYHSSLNLERSRNRLLGLANGFGNDGSRPDNHLAPLRTFMERMLSLPDKNVVVVLAGDFVRIPDPDGSHGNGAMSAVFGKYVRQGVSFPCSAAGTFASTTPNVEALYAAIAAALKVPGQPFGANPHRIV